MKKVKYTGTITLIDGSTVTVADDPANGTTNAQIVRDSILKLAQSVYVENDVEKIIPYHSILKAEFTREEVEVEAPVDETCVEVED